jgi:hypothetical protein
MFFPHQKKPKMSTVRWCLSYLHFSNNQCLLVLPFVSRQTTPSPTPVLPKSLLWKVQMLSTNNGHHALSRWHWQMAGKLCQHICATFELMVSSLFLPGTSSQIYPLPCSLAYTSYQMWGVKSHLTNTSEWCYYFKGEDPSADLWTLPLGSQGNIC